MKNAKTFMVESSIDADEIFWNVYQKENGKYIYTYTEFISSPTCDLDESTREWLEEQIGWDYLEKLELEWSSWAEAIWQEYRDEILAKVRKGLVEDGYLDDGEAVKFKHDYTEEESRLLGTIWMAQLEVLESMEGYEGDDLVEIYRKKLGEALARHGIYPTRDGEIHAPYHTIHVS